MGQASEGMKWLWGQLARARKHHKWFVFLPGSYIPERLPCSKNQFSVKAKKRLDGREVLSVLPAALELWST